MRTKTIVAVFIILFVAGTVFAGGDVKKAEKRAFNYVAYFLGSPDPGTITFSGKVVHVRGAQNTWFHDASDERIRGTVTNVLNSNLDSTGSGVVWGTWQSGDANAGWEGTWNGQQYNSSVGEMNWIIKFAGHGTGTFEGLMIDGMEAWDLIPPTDRPLVGYGVGEITNVNKD